MSIAMMVGLLFLCFHGLEAVRIEEEDADVADHAVVGMRLRDRYVLQSFLYRLDNAVNVEEHNGYPVGKDFPKVDGSRGAMFDSFMNRPTRLGTGSFGDVWQAYDTKQERPVAVKFFYDRYTKQGVTWANANYDQQRELHASVNECNLVKNILDSKWMYPTGASRICKCYEQHVTDGKHQDPLFLVLELCGRDMYANFIEPHKKAATKDITKARRLTKQLLEGIAFLQMFKEPLIHHDLKPGNVCITDDGDVKIIDWGGVVTGTYFNQFTPAVATPRYTPPEVANRFRAFALPPHSYDVYAAGLIHMELLCPQLRSDDWFYKVPLTEDTVKSVLAKACPDITSQIDADIRLIMRLIAYSAYAPYVRQAPMDALKATCLQDSNILQRITKQCKFKFESGEEAEYFIDSEKRWTPVEIVSTESSDCTYKVKDTLSLQAFQGVGEDMLRRKDKDGSASLNPALLLPMEERGRIGGGEGEGASALIIPTGRLDENNEVQEPECNHSLCDREKADEIKITYVNIYGMGNFDNRQYTVKVSASCEHTVTCTWEKVLMTCQGGQPQEFDKLEPQGSYGRIHAFLSWHQRLQKDLGKLCTVTLYAEMMPKKGTDDDQKKVKSYDHQFVFKETHGR